MKPRLKLLLDGRMVSVAPRDAYLFSAQPAYLVLPATADGADSSVGLRLRGIREKQGLTSAAMADHVDLSRAHWSALENDRVAPSRKLLKALRREFAVRESYVLSGTPPIYEGSAA